MYELSPCRGLPLPEPFAVSLPLAGLGHLPPSEPTWQSLPAQRESGNSGFQTWIDRLHRIRPIPKEPAGSPLVHRLRRRLQRRPQLGMGVRRPRYPQSPPVAQGQSGCCRRDFAPGILRLTLWTQIVRNHCSKLGRNKFNSR
jgi:hypothetical protein